MTEAVAIAALAAALVAAVVRDHAPCRVLLVWPGQAPDALAPPPPPGH